MNIDWAAIVNKVPEIAMFLVVVWFTLRMMELKNVSIAAMVAEHTENINKIASENTAVATKLATENAASVHLLTTEFSASIEKIMARNLEQSKITMGEWRDFLKSQRQEDREAMTHLAKDVAELSGIIHELFPRTIKLEQPKERNPKTRPLP